MPHTGAFLRIHQALCDRGVLIAERTVTNLLQRYEELVELHLADQQRLRERFKEQGQIIRDSRYLGHLLRNKSATRGTDGEGEPMPERRDEVMPEPGGSFELGECLTSCVFDHDTSWR